MPIVAGEVCLEAGALLLADRGICFIDELDKLPCDAHALLEAMEQQSVSIAKAGICTSLRSRTSVVAAANPAGGSYNRRKGVAENIKMNAALLTRFGKEFDTLLSTTVLNSFVCGCRSYLSYGGST